MVIVDAQSVKNTDTAHVKGYDGGKKISGIKRHIAVDSQGLPHAMTITAANVTDRQGANDMFSAYQQALVDVAKVLADGGYTGTPFQESVRESIGAIVEIAKRSELHTFAVIPKRWVVERSFAWLEKCRRLWKNCERLLSSSIGMMQLAFIGVLLRRS
jgi:transposase